MDYVNNELPLAYTMFCFSCYNRADFDSDDCRFYINETFDPDKEYHCLRCHSPDISLELIPRNYREIKFIKRLQVERERGEEHWG